MLRIQFNYYQCPISSWHQLPSRLNSLFHTNQAIIQRRYCKVILNYWQILNVVNGVIGSVNKLIVDLWDADNIEWNWKRRMLLISRSRAVAKENLHRTNVGQTIFLVSSCLLLLIWTFPVSLPENGNGWLVQTQMAGPQWMGYNDVQLFTDYFRYKFTNDVLQWALSIGLFHFFSKI